MLVEINQVTFTGLFHFYMHLTPVSSELCISALLFKVSQYSSVQTDFTLPGPYCATMETKSMGLAVIQTKGPGPAFIMTTNNCLLMGHFVVCSSKHSKWGLFVYPNRSRHFNTDRAALYNRHVTKYISAASLCLAN